MTTCAIIVAIQNITQSYIEQMLQDDFTPLATNTYNCFHPHFDSFLTSVYANIAHHQKTTLVPSMLVLL
jgi:hypothetical protein